MKALKPGVVLLVAMAAMSLQSVCADQPHMKAALMHLREPRAALVKAEHNKNGHRERAMELVNQAVSEVKSGMAAATR